MRLLFMGDIVGRSGRDALIAELPGLRRELGLDFVVVNGENAAGGFGITGAICDEIFDAGADVITLGNHSWDQREALVHIEREPRLVRPANYPPGTPGRGAALVESASGARVLVVNALGRVFMEALDCPFEAIDRQISACPLGEGADAIIVDMHAEATSEKMAMAHYCDGRASLVVGTHSHVPTADAQILPGGTAYQTDAGMCGDYNSVIGMEKDEPLNRFLTRIPSGRFQPALGPATLCGVFVETESSGLARRVEPVRIGGRLAQVLPEV
ncbi:MAG: TIGR00282 family metallophosphoesterase [Parvibaculum sp.]|jgi:metallophosphoesterase (TIGR00282 family)|uniref:TIGR00282 family metallophosphoesterase n=1 Tax=Parvibaculum sp. TaxID=2024848 RepID=UPI002ABAC1FB|nr:TIGR00282 family metallophosphoesterase [Parvibaculum sp.]MDZ4380229.1 TIGR00282 family metallophosphoesterase [Parvibaculum sp.]